MSSQTINVKINGRLHDLHVEQEAYNGKPAYYVTDKELSTLFDGELPDNLILFTTKDGLGCSPKVMSLEGRRITEEIWKAIQDQAADTPQPFGPGLG
ncbi:hypothetical protein F0L74_21150 [Chitinophaga agrisoli]|uniref:Uncharacterized protein n=1 Tax=Chitinophaga agrisoli TaxID=2607653 RepID=A0A5B2VKF4_9BACT|nr:hypothetical protein [Chitinophaga agrisoli]KAA2238727.1 hypothetical protein F0L74_21150 [Chitinophaga agrisoli]